MTTRSVHLHHRKVSSCATVAGLMILAVLGGCGTFRSLNGDLRDAPSIYSGTRLDWAALQGDEHYIRRYRLLPPSYPAIDLPFSFAADSLLLPLSIPRAGYQAIFVPAGL